MRKYENVKIEKLIPYKNNARVHDEKQIEKIANSIKEFGFINPLLIDENYNILAGHGRLEGAKKIGLDSVPCIFVEDLTEHQKKAYILTDNKLTLDARWNYKLLDIELNDLQENDFDINLTGFDLGRINVDEIIEDEEESYYGSERERTNKTYNLNLIDSVDLTNDFWEMPIINNNNYIPKDLIGFNYAKSNKSKNVGIHFYVDDYQFERVWNSPEKYISTLIDYDCILSPDFSLYKDMPMPMKIWNVYRSRKIGAYYQSKGIRVIPTISWAEEETFQFCFQGIEKGSIVSISTIGVKNNEEGLEMWKLGVEEMIKQIQPSVILVYGGKIDYDFGNIKVVYYENKVTKDWSERNENKKI